MPDTIIPESDSDTLHLDIEVVQALESDISDLNMIPSLDLSPTLIFNSLFDPSQSPESMLLADFDLDTTLFFSKRRRILLWFRKDLRLHDHPSLTAAMNAADPDDVLFPIYIIHRPKQKRCGAVRFQFLLECLQDLADSIHKKGSRLLILRGEAYEVLSIILRAWKITHLFFEKNYMPYAVQRDDTIVLMAHALGVDVQVLPGATLHDPLEVVRRNDGQVPLNIRQFLRIVSEMPQPQLPLPIPSTVPEFETVASLELLYSLIEVESVQQYSLVLDAEALLQFVGFMTGKSHALFAVPALACFEYAIPTPHSFLYGGESHGVKRLNAFCAIEERVGMFEKQKTSPVQLDPPSTTALSAYICFGCLSVREVFYCIMFIQLKFSAVAHGTPETTLDGQLLWREFFYCYAVNLPDFADMYKNPQCKVINWKLANVHVEDYHSIASTARETTTGEALDTTALTQLDGWVQGKTGYPWIDAVMRQIRTEGWAHHIGRYAVACFLTRGDLYIAWIHGASVFQELLIDMDWALNVGNWLWVSCSCFNQHYQSVHSPSSYVQQFCNDKEAISYIRRYIPELESIPAKYVFEPWRAPLNVQKASNCLIGKDYPFPMIDHQVASKRCIAGLRKHFEQSSH